MAYGLVLARAEHDRLARQGAQAERGQDLVGAHDPEAPASIHPCARAEMAL